MSPDRKRDLRRFRCAVARTRAFLGDSEGERGMAATEFALILPVALVLLTGVFTFGMVNQINQKVTITARTITDLVAQCSEIASADMSTMLNATAQVMSPFSASNTTVIVSEVQVPATG